MTSIQVVENFVNDLGLCDEGKDLKSPATLTEEGVGFKDPTDQECPSSSPSSSPRRRWFGLMGIGVGQVGSSKFAREVVHISQSTRSGGIETKVMNVMFSRLWNLDEDASDKFKDIEGLPVGMVEQTQLGVVVRGFSLVEEGACAFSPMDAGQRDGAP